MSDQVPQPVSKKHKSKEEDSEGGKKKTQGVKSVKAVDPAIVEQRRDAVQSRVLRLESKLAKDRALLAKYSVQTGEGNKASEEGEGSDDA
jgi:hypothetical protein